MRVDIGRKVRALRTLRRWTQAELAERLHLSQARLSELERGKGSFSAEHLLESFRLFNVDASYFASAPADPTTVLQNALARLGATHLVESEGVLPSERVAHVNEVVRETLVDASQPRLLTALAPVLVARIDAVHLHQVEAQLATLGLQHRLGWLVDNTCTALRESKESSTPVVTRQRRRAAAVLSGWLSAARARAPGSSVCDVLDPAVRSEETLKLVADERTDISRRWGVLTSLTVADFAKALEAADATT